MFTIPIPSRVKHEDNQSFCYVNFGYSPDCKSSPKSCPRRAQRISCDCWKAISPPTSYVNLNVSFVFKNRWELCGCHFSLRGTETKEESLEVRIRAARVSLLPLLSCEACCPTTIDRRWLRLLWEGLSLVKSRVLKRNSSSNRLSTMFYCSRREQFSYKISSLRSSSSFFDTPGIRW